MCVLESQSRELQARCLFGDLLHELLFALVPQLK
jgi:hypothetical protein